MLLVQLMVHDTETPKHLRGLYPKRCGVGKITIDGKVFEALFPTQEIAENYFENTFNVSPLDWDFNRMLDCKIISTEVNLK